MPSVDFAINNTFQNFNDKYLLGMQAVAVSMTNRTTMPDSSYNTSRPSFGDDIMPSKYAAAFKDKVDQTDPRIGKKFDVSV